ncbi:MAG: hypothetical protein AAF438_16490, partial [Pseudomonadota bacterium]
VIEVEWETGKGDNSKLFLYRAVGAMLTEPADVVAQGKCLEWQTWGKAIRYVDAEVKDGQTYNYYVWIELEVVGHAIAFCLDKQSFVVNEKEDFERLVVRTEKTDALKKRLKRIRDPDPEPDLEIIPDEPEPTLVENVLDEVDTRMERQREYKRVRAALQEKFEKAIAAGDLTEAEAEIQHQEALQSLEAKMLSLEGRR